MYYLIHEDVRSDTLKIPLNPGLRNSILSELWYGIAHKVCKAIFTNFQKSMTPKIK